MEYTFRGENGGGGLGSLQKKIHKLI